uniref:Large ribosomal subunit protein uL16c n=3 Tax=Vischeria TaxID=44431 RepID=A0A5P8SZI8_9STRA|nr:ribosomal protein L16 [Vischeria sp. ACOI 3415]YP_010451066.1 ribosomal protein L16 [Vischeria punctata]AOW70852.1 ribosomal protein L16 [Vischeria sp. CAUP Q 202]QFR99660.1 ribosomal protein L16 [Vischeria stellata]QAA12098.1 ribosomal protein L16 [Vischeria sp. ACOI 3415]UTV00847.1 ribosomal protein L16 [Vischeria punctata]
MLSPKRTKFRKQQRGRLRGKTIQKKSLAFGEYGLQAQEPVWLTARQIEATRRTITRYTKRGGKLWIMVFPDKPITARAEESRMGSGKGAPQYWVSVVKPGKVLFELAGVAESIAVHALRMAAYKLPIKTKLISAKDSQ